MSLDLFALIAIKIEFQKTKARPMMSDKRAITWEKYKYICPYLDGRCRSTRHPNYDNKEVEECIKSLCPEWNEMGEPVKENEMRKALLALHTQCATNLSLMRPGRSGQMEPQGQTEAMLAAEALLFPESEADDGNND